MASSSTWCICGVLSLLFVLLSSIEASPAYFQANYNSVGETLPATNNPTQQSESTRSRATDNSNNGGRRTLQSVIRPHLQELDKETQHDLKILSYLENELNLIFSCYIRLSCPRTRSAKALAECDEIKDWPLYHQVMRMAGIRRYPYQNYSPQYRSTPSVTTTSTARSTTTTTPASPPQQTLFDYQRTGRRERTMPMPVAEYTGTYNNNNNNNANNFGTENGIHPEDEENEEAYQRDARHRPRRVPRGQQKFQHIASLNEISD